MNIMDIRKEFNKTKCYLYYRLCIIGKNTKTGNYLYYVKSYKAIQKTVLIHKSKRKSLILNKYTLTILALLINSVGIILLAVLYPIISYINGGKNWITDSFCCNDVRFFNLVNFVGLIGTLGYLYFR